jgi:hypothetical protein
VVCVFMVKQILDLAQLKNKENKMEYFNALLATVMGDEDQRQAAIKYLKEVDPDIWDQEE